MAETLNISSIRLYNFLKNKFGEKEAEEFVPLVFVPLVKDEVNYNFEVKKDILATKEDLHSLELKLSEKISQLETKLAQNTTKMILWAFVFWATQVGAIFALLRFLPH